MPESFVGVPPDSTGKKLRTRQRTIGANVVDEQYLIAGSERVISYRGRAGTFRIPGRAAASVGRSLWQLFNTTGSGVLVALEAVTVDVFSGAVKAVTAVPPTPRLYRTTAALTGGAALTKAAMDTAQTSPSGVALLQDATADGTVAATQLGGTALPSGAVMMTQEFTPRIVGTLGVVYEVADRMEFLGDEPAAPILREGQGAVLRIDYPAAASEPTTDQWISTLRWSEFTLP